VPLPCLAQPPAAAAPARVAQTGQETHEQLSTRRRQDRKKQRAEQPARYSRKGQSFGERKEERNRTWFSAAPMTRVPQRAAAPLTPGCSWRNGEVGRAGAGGMERWSRRTRLGAWTVEEGMGKRGERASEDLAGETWGRRVCVGERREEGERETARAQSVTVGVAFSPVRWLTQGSGDVVGPAWQWAVGRV